MNANFNPKVSFYDSVFGRSHAIVHIGQILEAIKNGRWAERIEQIRSVTNPDERNRLKKNLPAFTASGMFRKRTKENLIRHTGLIQIDLDHIGADRVEEVKYTIAGLPYFLAVFASPSGDGVKALFRIPANPQWHVKAFFALERLFADFGYTIDKAVKDITRLCFVSYDPHIYINPNPKIFHFQYFETKNIQSKKKVLTTA